MKNKDEKRKTDPTKNIESTNKSERELWYICRSDVLKYMKVSTTSMDSRVFADYCYRQKWGDIHDGIFTRVLQSLQHEGKLKLRRFTVVNYELTDNGKIYDQQGTPEMQIYQAVVQSSSGELSLQQLKQVVGDMIFNEGLRIAEHKQWIVCKDNRVECGSQYLKTSGKRPRDDLKLSLGIVFVGYGGKVNKDDKSIMNELIRRGWVFKTSTDHFDVSTQEWYLRRD